jgi:hypothetical protein
MLVYEITAMVEAVDEADASNVADEIARVIEHERA